MRDVLDSVRQLRREGGAEETSSIARSTQDVIARVRANLMSSIEGHGKHEETDMTEAQQAQERAPLPRMISQLAYNDIDAALAFLTEAFSFRERKEVRFMDSDGRVGHAEMETGSGVFMLGHSGGHGLASPSGMGSPNQMLCVYVRDIEAHYRQAVDAGVTIREPIQKKFWGDRTYEALDCEGHRWVFHQQDRVVTPLEWSEAAAEEADAT